ATLRTGGLAAAQTRPAWPPAFRLPRPPPAADDPRSAREPRAVAADRAGAALAAPPDRRRATRAAQRLRRRRPRRRVGWRDALAPGLRAVPLHLQRRSGPPPRRTGGAAAQAGAEEAPQSHRRSMVRPRGRDRGVRAARSACRLSPRPRHR